MMKLHFKGWFQCRLATDPDPFDEPRGVSGWTFALTGESDFDRIIRFQPPSSHNNIRYPGRDIGVRVFKISYAAGLNQKSRNTASEILKFSNVNLVEEPRFEGRNASIDGGDGEIIDPFHIHIYNDRTNISIKRRYVLDPNNPYASLEYLVKNKRSEVRDIIKRRQPVITIPNHMFISGKIDTPSTGKSAPDAKDDIIKQTDVYEYSGIGGLCRIRYDEIKKMLDDNHEHPNRVALLERLDYLSCFFNSDTCKYRSGGFADPFFMMLSYDFPITGPSQVDGPDDLVNMIDSSSPWRIEFWMGGWEPDVLCGFVYGSLSIPFQRVP